LLTFRDGDPVKSMLEQGQFPEVASALRSQIDSIIQEWIDTIQRILPTAHELTLAQVRNDLPEVLRLMADALECRSTEDFERLLNIAPLHGSMRFFEGFSPAEMLTEYRVLRSIAVRWVEFGLGRRLSTDEHCSIDVGIDLVTQRSLVSFIDHQNERLRAANDAEAKFISFLSHDLRNSLNHVQLSMEVIKRRMAGEPEFKEDAEEVESLQRAIRGTVNGMERLLQWRRLREGGTEAKPGPVDLRELAASVERDLMPEGHRKGIKIVNDVPAGSLATTDRDLLAIAVQNLAGNGVKYSMEGTVRIGAERRVIGTDTRWAVWVADEGKGIEKDQLQRMFAAFERGHETHDQPGFGLGLTIVSEVAQKLGATLEVRSVQGDGSVFTILLPAEPASN
jgi:signal transduction histidine kinase